MTGSWWSLRRSRRGLGRLLDLLDGDDETDEDAFRALADVGVGVLVSDEPRRTAASYRLRDTEETRRFLARLAAGAEA